MFPAGLPAGFHTGARAVAGDSENRAWQSVARVQPQRCLAAVVAAILLELRCELQLTTAATIGRGTFVRGDERGGRLQQ